MDYKKVYYKLLGAYLMDYKKVYYELLEELAIDQLVVLEEDLNIRIDELEDEIGSLFSQLEDIWEEYGIYDDETGDYLLKGNAFHYEENLQAEMILLEDKLGASERQLKDVKWRLECLRQNGLQNS